jgi:hypothetical protein
VSTNNAICILVDVAVVVLLNKIEEDCIREIRTSKMVETEVREKAYNLLTAVDLLKRNLRSVYDTGKMAEVQLVRRGRPPKNRI